MLKFLFQWLDSHAWSYWLVAAVPTLLFFAWSVHLLRNDREKPLPDRYPAAFALLIFGMILAWRWPYLLSADEYNPDESQLIAGALTLWVDPVPWRGVDGFTSGPLNFYPAALPKLLGLPIDYFTARLMGLLLIWGALMACHRLLLSWFGRSWALLGILPGLAFFCTATNADFVHFSSEHLSLFLIALSAWCIFRRHENETARPRWLAAGAAIAGLLPWAKLQSGPIGAILVAAALFEAIREKPGSRAKFRSALFPIAGAATPTLLILVVIVVSGQTRDFLPSYILQNVAYVGDGHSLAYTVQGLWGNFRATNFAYFGGTTLAVALVGATSSLAKPRFKPLALMSLSAVSIGCILTARRPFLHYLLLCIIPLTLWSAVSLARFANSLSERRRHLLAFSALVIGFGLPFGLRITQPVPEMFGNFAIHWREPRTALSQLIRSAARPGARVAVWGWRPSLFVETGLPQGTRDGNTSWAMERSPQQPYYLDRILADLRRIQPDFFVDAVGQGSFYFSNRSGMAHEHFEAIGDYVRDNYRLVADYGYARLYVQQGSPDLPKITAAVAAGGENVGPSLTIDQINPPDLPQLNLRNGYVQMMHPPAEISWKLDETTREVLVEYGFSQEAYRLKNRSDGVELIFELHSPGAPVRHLFYRELDPRHRPADRGPTSSLLILPPFKPGSKLVARTTVGLAGNDAWDWVYIGRVSPVALPHFSPAQFPGFNRVPDAADADFSYLLQDPEGAVLVLHAPARLTYNLNGQETRVRFDFGFREGAYTKDGQTDGATFRVALENPGGASEILFEKRLDPLGVAADRGTQSADFAIPAGPAGRKLLVLVDPGKGNAWDWTYLNHFVLE